MHCPYRLPCLAAVGLVLWTASVEKAVGQVPDSVRQPGAILVGHVTDTMGAALAGVEIIIAHRADSAVVRAALTDTAGNVMLRDLAPGDSYTVRARKIGYLPSQTTGVSFRSGDTLAFEVALRPFVQTLPELVASDTSLPVAAMVSDGFIFKPFSFFKCFAIGIEFPVVSEILSWLGVRQKRGSAAALGKPGEFSPYDCSQQAEDKRLAREREREDVRRAKDAARRASKAERELEEAKRRIEEAQRAGRSPKHEDVLRVLRAVPACGPKVPDGALCRDRILRPSRETLDSLFRTMAAAGTVADSVSEP